MGVLPPWRVIQIGTQCCKPQCPETMLLRPSEPRRIRATNLVGGTMMDRRGFLSSFAGIAGAAGTLGLSPELPAWFEQEPPKLPDSALYSSNEEAYWTELRAVFDGYYETEKMAQSDPEDYPIWGYASWNEFRDPLAEFVGCTRDEIALVRNATEANSYIANGLDLKPGDEVLMTDQEHPGGEHPWNLRAKRYG